MMKHLSTIVFAGFVLAGCDMFSPDEPVSFSRVEEVPYLLVKISGTTVLRDQSSWETFWQQHGGSAPAPYVDFDQQVGLGVFYGGSFHVGCHSQVAVVQDVTRIRNTLEVNIGRLPDLGECRAVVHPYDLVIVEVPPSEARDVRFVGRVP